MRCRSLEKEIDRFENKINKNNNRTNLLYKRNNKILSRTTSNGYKNYFTLENNSLNSANSINNKNNYYDNSNEKKNSFLKTFLKDKKMKNIIGREIDDNFDEKYEFLEEDNSIENNKINDEIKELLKQRDIEINNIMIKYQDKMDKMKKEQNKKTIEE